MTDSQKIELRISVPSSNAYAKLLSWKATAYSDEVQIENRELQERVWPARRTEAGQPDC